MSIGCAPWMVAPAASPLVFCSMSSTGFYLCLFFFLSLILLLLGVSVVVQICGLPVYARQSPLMVRYVQPSKNCRKKVIFFWRKCTHPLLLKWCTIKCTISWVVYSPLASASSFRCWQAAHHQSSQANWGKNRLFYLLEVWDISSHPTKFSSTEETTDQMQPNCTSEKWINFRIPCYICL